MTNDAKTNCYTSIYQELKDNPEISNLTYPEERKNFDFSCMVGPVAVTFGLRYEQDQCMIRGMFTCEDKTHDNINDFLSELTKGEDNITGFGSPGTGVISMSILLQGLSDEKATEKLIGFTRKYFRFLIDNKPVIEDFLAAAPRPKKAATQKKESANTESLLGNALSGMTGAIATGTKKSESSKVEKPKETAPVTKVTKKPEAPRKEERPKKKEKPAKETLDISMSKALEKEKAEFRQYCEDQRHLFDNEASKLEEREAKIKQLEDKIESERLIWSTKRSELEQLEKQMLAEKTALEEKKNELKGQALGLNKERKELKAEKDKWDNTSIDEKLVQRRKELEKLENNLYKKEKDFQKFQDDTLNDISDRLDTVAEKEKELIKKQGDLRKQQDDQKSLDTEIDLRYKKLQEKEKQIAKKEAELSELEAELRRTEILKQEAENELKKLEVRKKNFEIKEEQLGMKVNEFNQREEAFTQKYHDVMLDITSLEDKRAALEQKEADVRILIGKNEGLEAQLRELKEDTDKISNTIKEKDDEIGRKEDLIVKLKKSVKTAEDKLRQEQKKAAAASEENVSLQKRATTAEDKVKDYETEIARVRTELYTTKEALKTKESPKKSVAEKPAVPIVKDTPETLLKVKKLQESERQLRENCDVLTKNIEALEERCQKAEAARDNMESDSLNQVGEMQEQITQLEERLAAAENNTSDISESDLTTIGAQPIVGERDGLYGMESDGCKIFIDTENHVIQVKKEVRKPAKYVKDIMALNQEDITETYFLEKSSVACRKTYKSDVSEAIQNALTAFENMK